MTNTAIATAFSKGDFESTYPYIATDAIWIVVEEATYNGKPAIVQQCEQVGNYFKSISTYFVTEHVVTEKSKVVISGTAEFIREGERISFVHACDVYVFNENNQIQQITSYCIESKKG